MKTERFLLEHIREHGISEEVLEGELGFSLKQLVDAGEELPADRFLELCRYIGITPEQVIDRVFPGDNPV